MRVYICCVNNQSSHRLPPDKSVTLRQVREGFTYLPNAVLEIFLLGLQKAKKRKKLQTLFYNSNPKMTPTCQQTLRDRVNSRSQMSDAATLKRPR